MFVFSAKYVCAERVCIYSTPIVIHSIDLLVRNRNMLTGLIIANAYFLQFKALIVHTLSSFRRRIFSKIVNLNYTIVVGLFLSTAYINLSSQCFHVEFRMMHVMILTLFGEMADIPA